MTTRRASSLHVAVRGAVFVAFCFRIAFWRSVGAITMGPGILRGSFVSAAGATVATSFSALSAASIASSIILALVVDLGLEACLHLCEHVLILLRRVGHVVELLFHLLLGDLVGGPAVAVGGQPFDDLVDDGVRSSVVSESISSDGGLALLNRLLCCLEVDLGTRPGLLNVGFVVSFSDVARKDGGSGDYDQGDVDQLSGCFCSIGGFCHVGVIVDSCKDNCDGPGMVVNGCLHFCFGGSEGLWSDRSEGVEKVLEDLGDCACEDPSPSSNSARQSSSRALLICWRMERSIWLHAW
jgi:hypothetical protein